MTFLRLISFMSMLLVMSCWVTPAADAGFVGTGTGNDDLDNIEDVIDLYNAANDPDLSYPTGVLEKTDEAAFASIAGDFVFSSDEDGNDVIGYGDLGDYEKAYFQYLGDDPLLYYSVKADGGFSLYEYMSGSNVLEFQDSGYPPPKYQISHVTFWTGTPLDPHVVPELGTWSMSFAAVVAGLLIGAAKFWKASKSLLLGSP